VSCFTREAPVVLELRDSTRLLPEGELWERPVWDDSNISGDLWRVRQSAVGRS